MSKKSRTFQPSDTRPPTTGATGGTPPAATPGAADPSATPPAPTPPRNTSSGGSRAEARRRSTAPKASAQQSFFDRYRVLILGGAGVVVAIFALLFFLRPGNAAYECVSFLTPPPATAPDASGAPASGPSAAPSVAPTASEAPATNDAPTSSAPSTSAGPLASGAAPSAAPVTSPAPGASAPAPSAAPTPTPAPTPLLGFPTTDLGREHAAQGASVRYDYCPPASGRHYNLGAGLAPLARRFYERDLNFSPQHWIHNLEHGYTVILYKGDPGAQALAELQRVMDDASPSTWNLTNCGAGAPNKVIVVRFDGMDPGVNFAAVSWDRALLQEQLDADELLAFAEQWQDGPATPERVCG
ncbi:MAG: DUF3105 domain-containing protein [Candidatus Limnocylindrales bacterium]